MYSAEPGAEGQWFYVSPQVEQLTGYTPEEWTENPHLWYSRVHPDDKEAFIAGEAEALAEGRSFQMEYRFFRKDGKTIWIQDGSLNVTQESTDEKKIVQGFLLDVTARRDTEEKLRTNETLLASIIDTIPFDFWVCDENDRYILQNPVSKALAGDLINKTVEDLGIPPDLIKNYREKHQRVLAGETLRTEESYQMNGDTFHVLFIGTPIRMDQKNRGFIGMTIDITEQKRTAEALKDAELLYRTLVEQSSVALYRDYAVEGGPSIFITHQIENMLGYTPEEFSSSPEFWQSLLHPDDHAMVMEVIDRIIETGEKITCEYRMKSSDGRWVWLRDEARAIKDSDGKPLYVQGVYVDITNEKLMGAQRESLIVELEAKNAELERFTYTVSHDLKSPLITMGGFLGFLEKDAMSGNFENLKTDIYRINEANQKMETLLNELLELSRIGRLINEPETVPFGQIVQDALSRVESRLKENQVEVRVGSDLPLVRGDRTRLVEVVQNLVDNAAKFIRAGGTQPWIEIGARAEDNFHIFYVRDNGIGVEPRFQDKIFDLFSKLNPRTDGTGIGLSIVKRIIEVHNGKIWVESEFGKGTTFWFTFPKV